MKPTLSIIIPVLNEAKVLPNLMRDIADCQQELDFPVECIVVDGGSDDYSGAICSEFDVRFISSEQGRGVQLYQGAKQAHGETLLFLHADCRLTKQHCLAAFSALENNDTIAGGFHLGFDDRHWIFKFAQIVNKLRFKITQIIYGDHGFFLNRQIYNEIGGFRQVPLFEDVDICRRLKKKGELVLIQPVLRTSTRRFRADGIVRTYLRMAGLHILYWTGVSPHYLARVYFKKGRLKTI